MNYNYSKEILLNQVDSVKKLVNITMKYSEDIDLVRGRYTIDAKSIMGVFSLDLSRTITIIIHTDDSEIANKFFSDLENVGIK